jgi:hypothetical protein
MVTPLYSSVATDYTGSLLYCDTPVSWAPPAVPACRGLLRPFRRSRRGRAPSPLARSGAPSPRPASLPLPACTRAGGRNHGSAHSGGRAHEQKLRPEPVSTTTPVSVLALVRRLESKDTTAGPKDLIHKFSPASGSLCSFFPEKVFHTILFFLTTYTSTLRIHFTTSLSTP